MYQKLSLVLSLLICVQIAPATPRIDKHITTRSGEEGILYYIHKQKGFKGDQASLIFDQTTIISEDSVRVGLTLESDISFRPDSLIILSDDLHRRGYAVEPSFTEMKGRDWINRIFVMVLRSDVEALFDQSTPPVIYFRDESQQLGLTTSQRKWEKMRELNQLIYQQIELNR